MFDVEPWTGSVVVSGPLSRDYVAISYFQVQANNTEASYQVRKTDVGTASLRARENSPPSVKPWFRVKIKLF